MTKHLLRRLSLLLALVILLSTGGVWAAWMYTNPWVVGVKHEVFIQMGDFFWSGSGDLPTDSEVGENHLSLIDQIINHPEHGLNKKNSYLNKQIDDRKDGGIGWSKGRDTLGSMAVTQSEELREIFGLDASSLTFLIQFVSNDRYYIFTTGEYLGARGEINFWGNNKTPGRPTVPIGQPISVIYRTTVDLVNGKWTAVETKTGYALSAWYEESRSNANATQIPSFDPDTFQEGEPPA